MFWNDEITNFLRVIKMHSYLSDYNSGYSRNGKMGLGGMQ